VKPIKGTIKSLPEDRDTGERRGFGFIMGEDDVERFFLATALQQFSPTRFDALDVGDPVTFTGIDHPRGPRAIEVRATKTKP